MGGKIALGAVAAVEVGDDGDEVGLGHSCTHPISTIGVVWVGDRSHSEEKREEVVGWYGTYDERLDRMPAGRNRAASHRKAVVQGNNGRHIIRVAGDVAQICACACAVVRVRGRSHCKA